MSINQFSYKILYFQNLKVGQSLFAKYKSNWKCFLNFTGNFWFLNQLISYL